MVPATLAGTWTLGAVSPTNNWGNNMDGYIYIYIYDYICIYPICLIIQFLVKLVTMVNILLMEYNKHIFHVFLLIQFLVKLVTIWLTFD